MNRLTFAKKAVCAIRDVWLISGVVLIMIVLLELALGVYFAVADVGKVDGRHKADSYADTEWVREYFKEHVASSVARWESYVYWRCTPFKGRYVNVNEQGLRRTVNHAPTGQQASPPLRIFMFGGSTLWGTGTPDEYTISSLLSGLLHDKGFYVEVTNFGALGYVSTQGVIALIRQLQSGNVPDVVIFYDGFNDVWAGYQIGQAGLPLNEVNRRKEFNLLNAQQTNFPAAVLFHHTLPGINRLRKTGLFKARRDPKLKDRTRPIELSEKIVEVYANNVRVVEALGKEYGFKTAFYWQPTIADKKWLTDYEKREKDIFMPMNSFFETTYGIMNEAAQLNANAVFHNISKIFAENKEPLFIDCVHVVDRGNRILAEKMSEDVAVVLAGELHARSTWGN